MSNSLQRAATALALACLGCGAAVAEDLPTSVGSVGPTHAPPQADRSAQTAQTLTQSFEAAWRHRQSARLSEGRQLRATAAQTAAASLFNGSPSVALSSRTDRFNADQGAVEYELGLNLPIWLPGQRASQQSVAQAERAWADEADRMDRFELYKQVSELAWDAQAASAQLTLATQQSELLASLVSEVERRFTAGELAKVDLLDIRAEWLNAQSAQHEARLKLESLRNQWLSTTGLHQWPVLPAPTEADLSPPATQPDEHPQQRLSELALERATRQLDAARQDKREAPELSLGYRQERSGHRQPSERSLGLGLRWSFGSSARNQPLIAQALQSFNEAQHHALVTRRQLDAERRTTQSAAEIAQQQRLHAIERHALLQERAQLALKAFKAGEADLPTLLRARSAAAQAASALAQSEAALGLAISRKLLSHGLQP